MHLFDNRLQPMLRKGCNAMLSITSQLKLLLCSSSGFQLMVHRNTCSAPQAKQVGARSAPQNPPPLVGDKQAASELASAADRLGKAVPPNGGGEGELTETFP